MHDVIVESPIVDSFRVQQVASCFDLPIREKSTFSLRVQVPPLEGEWRIGAIVGPSGSGKTVLGRSLFGENFKDEPGEWPTDRAVIDAFPGDSIKTITDMLTAVGFSSPPSWVRPYQVLSNGERFRCDLARALLEDRPLVAMDEFTSLVDRTVARHGAFAVAKAIRRIPSKRFVAISCHYDFLEWLQPDWTLDLATGQVSTVRLRRPAIVAEIHPCPVAYWAMFGRHHYLSAEVNRTSKCYLLTVEGQPVGFISVLPTMGMSGVRRISRVVILPDYQGVGLGMRFCDAIADLYGRQGMAMRITTGHIGMIASMMRSSKWSLRSVVGLRSVKQRGFMAKTQTRGRITRTFEYRRSA